MSTDDQTDPRGVQRNRPDTVDALASTVISVLRSRQTVSIDGLRQFVLDYMVRTILAKGHFSPDALLAELRGYRLSIDAIIDQYVPTTARILGDHWVNDQISFADVTVGTLRLQALLSEASVAAQIDHDVGQEQISTLVLIPQQEQHFLGASVLAAQLRRLGCSVSMSYDEDFGSLTARLIAKMPDIVLMTCARRETLESVANTVQAVRQIEHIAPVIALGGALQMDEVSVIERTGVDIVTNAAEDAVALFTRRAKSQKRI